MERDQVRSLDQILNDLLLVADGIAIAFAAQGDTGMVGTMFRDKLYSLNRELSDSLYTLLGEAGVK